MAGAASQTGDADPSRAHGLTSGLQGSVNVQRGDSLLLVPQMYSEISSFVFTLVYFCTTGRRKLFPTIVVSVYRDGISRVAEKKQQNILS